MGGRQLNELYNYMVGHGDKQRSKTVRLWIKVHFANR